MRTPLGQRIKAHVEQRRVIEWRRYFFFSSRRRHTRLQGDWSSDVCSSDLGRGAGIPGFGHEGMERASAQLRMREVLQRLRHLAGKWQRVRQVREQLRTLHEQDRKSVV